MFSQSTGAHPWIVSVNQPKRVEAGATTALEGKITERRIRSRRVSMITPANSQSVIKYSNTKSVNDALITKRQSCCWGGSSNEEC